MFLWQFKKFKKASKTDIYYITFHKLDYVFIILSVIREYLQNHGGPIMTGFVTRHLDVIIQNTHSNKAIDKFWTSAINREALDIKKSLVNSFLR